MAHMKKILTIVLGCGSLFAAGCCGNPASQCNPCTPAGEVRGAFAYRLGAGMSTNSSSVKLSAAVDCPPPPPAAAFQAPAPCEPCAEVPVVQQEPLISNPVIDLTCATGSCEPSQFTAVVCAPGENLGDCITLPQERGAGDIEIYVPNSGVLEKITESMPIEGTGITQTPVKTEEPVATVVEEAVKTEEPVVAVVKAPAKVEEAVVVVTEAPAKAVEPVVEKIAEKVVDVAEKIEETTEVAVAPAAPPSLDDMPPVFRAGTTDTASEEILSSAANAASAEVLPRVELPPELK